jgi:hypothetical protein
MHQSCSEKLTALSRSGMYLTWFFICRTMFSLSERPSDAQPTANSLCKLSVLGDDVIILSMAAPLQLPTAIDTTLPVIVMASSSHSELVPVDSRLHYNTQRTCLLDSITRRFNHVRVELTLNRD